MKTPARKPELPSADTVKDFLYGDDWYSKAVFDMVLGQLNKKWEHVYFSAGYYMQEDAMADGFGAYGDCKKFVTDNIQFISYAIFKYQKEYGDIVFAEDVSLYCALANFVRMKVAKDIVKYQTNGMTIKKGEFKMEDFNTTAGYVPYQLCPKCGGAGYLYSATTGGEGIVCDLCDGKKVIPMAVIKNDITSFATPDTSQIKQNYEKEN